MHIESCVGIARAMSSLSCSIPLTFDGRLNKAFEKAVEYVLTILDELHSVVFPEDCKEDDVIKLKKLLQEYKVQASKLYSIVNNCIKTFKQCVDLNEEKESEIKEAVENCQYEILKAYVDKQIQILDKCKSAYPQCVEVHKSSDSICDKGVQLCVKKEKEALNSKFLTQAGGGTIAGLGALVGIGGIAGASVVAGMSTFGIGTPVILGIGAGVSAVGGTTATVTGITTHCIAMNYEKTAKVFKNITSGFYHAREEIADIDNAMDSLNEALTQYRLDIDMASDEEASKVFESFCQSYNMMLKTSRSRVVKCSEKMQSYASKIE